MSPAARSVTERNGYFSVEIQPTELQDKVGRTAGRLSAAGVPYHVFPVMCHVSPVTCQISLTPTATDIHHTLSNSPIMHTRILLLILT